MQRAQYIMLGGFLGAGKTTVIAYCAQKWQAAEKSVGIICNDQAAHLVDTAILSRTGAAVEEIAGGCFCCRFQSLQDAAQKLEREHCPDIFVAEPVGSCTDLVATVSYPMRRMYGDNYSIAPLTVVVDLARALRIFALRAGKKFSDKVVYIYKKQIEEAASIIINKIDMYAQEDIDELQAYIAQEYPTKEIFLCSARTGVGVDAWMQWIDQRAIAAGTIDTCMDVDYDIYAEGEAALGWYNASVSVHADETSMIDGNKMLAQLMTMVREQLLEKQAMIAHLKMTLSPIGVSVGSDIAAANIVDNETIPELHQHLSDEIQDGELIINLRAEADPEILRNAVHSALESFTTLTLEHEEYFRPGRPEPEYRMLSADVDR